MARLNIPERFRAGVARILRLDERTIQAIREALDNPQEVTDKNRSGMEVPGKPDAIAVSAVRSVADLNLAEFAQVAEALAGLYTAKSFRDVTLDDFVEDVCDAMEVVPEERWRVPRENRQEFKNKLFALLGSEYFAIIAKAYDLATEGRTFCSARILTDLRPVFGPEVDDGPQAMVVLHTLKLTYHETGQKHQDFMLALDADDLRSLKQMIDRAEKKADKLRPTIKDIRLFGIPKE